MMGVKSAIPKQLGQGRSKRAHSIRYLEPRCVNYLEHSHPLGGHPGQHIVDRNVADDRPVQDYGDALT